MYSVMSKSPLGTRSVSSVLTCLRVDGLMVLALDSRSNSLHSSHGQGHCVVFLGKTLYSHCCAPSRCIDGYQQI